MERHRAIRTALACALTIFVGLFLCSAAAASAHHREGLSLGPHIAVAHAAGVVAKRAIRTGSSLQVDKSNQHVSRERAGDDLPLHAWLPPRLTRPLVHSSGERVRAPSRSMSTFQPGPVDRWLEARAPPRGSFA